MAQAFTAGAMPQAQVPMSAAGQTTISRICNSARVTGATCTAPVTSAQGNSGSA